MHQKSACAILFPILLLLTGCIVVPFTPDDSETLATIENEMVVGVTTRESLINRLGQPDAIYELGRLWVFADADFYRGYLFIYLQGNGNTMYSGEVLFLISEFDDQGVLSRFRIEKVTHNARRNCTDSRFCYVTVYDKTLRVYRLATDDEEARAWSFDDPGEQCEVYLYEHIPWGNPIFLNGQNMGILGLTEGHRGFFNWRLNPGEHQIDVYGWNDAERKEPQTRHAFTCRAGERLFFKTKVHVWSLGKVSLAPVTEAKGRKDIKSRRLIAQISEGPPGDSTHKPQSGT